MLPQNWKIGKYRESWLTRVKTHQWKRPQLLAQIGKPNELLEVQVRTILSITNSRENEEGPTILCFTSRNWTRLAQ